MRTYDDFVLTQHRLLYTGFYVTIRFSNSSFYTLFYYPTTQIVIQFVFLSYDDPVVRVAVPIVIIRKNELP